MAHSTITIAGLKGGIAKTSLAVNLAAYWAEKGAKTLLIDADVNGSALKLYERGNKGLLPAGSLCVPLQQAPMAMAKAWDFVLMDTAGGSRDEQQTYAEGSDFVVCPCQPAASSIEQVIDLAEVIQATGTGFGVLLTMVDKRRASDAVKAKSLFKKLGIPTLKTEISLLSAWPKAECSGLAVKDAKADSGKPDPGAKKAWLQIGAVAAEIADQLGAAGSMAA